MTPTTSAPMAWAAVPAAAYLLVVAILVAVSVPRTGGRLVYPLDDTYVHMAIAKHTAQSGVWGVTSEQFTSASSSPLWTGLLALVYAATGVSESAPLILNVIIGLALVVSSHWLLAGAGLPPAAAAGWSLFVLLAGAVPTMTLIGMEHTLHALVAVWFVVLACWRATAAQGAPGLPAIALLAAVLTLTRYEGLFALGCVAVLFAAARRWRDAVVVIAAGVLPLLLFGAWSVSQGGFLLPNSVLLKGVAPVLTVKGLLQAATFWPALTALMAAPHLAFLLLAVVALSLRGVFNDAARGERAMAWVFAGSVLLHLQFARTGWFFRYENYLVVLGLVIAGLLMRGLDWGVARRRALAAATIALLIVLLAFPLARRGLNALRQVPGAAANIYEQQYQMGLFLDRFYQQQRVAVNDVGAVGFLADVKLFDLWGLASTEIARLKRRGEYDSGAVARLAARNGVAIAVIYPSWLNDFGGVPAHWQKTGQWTVADNLVLGESSVAFYAVAAGSREPLVRNLGAYADQLPTAVAQEGEYRADR